MAIGKKLDVLLKKNDLTVKELSNMTDINPSTLYMIIKRDNTKTDLDMLQRIANALNVSLDYFAGSIEYDNEAKKLEALSPEETARQGNLKKWSAVDTILELQGYERIPEEDENGINFFIQGKGNKYKVTPEDMNALRDGTFDYVNFKLYEIIQNAEKVKAPE